MVVKENQFIPTRLMVKRSFKFLNFSRICSFFESIYSFELFENAKIAKVSSHEIW